MHQPLRAAPAGQQAQLHFGQPQLGRGLVVDQPVIAGQGKLQPASQARAADHRQGRHRQRRQLVENRLALGGDRLGLRRGLDLEEVVKIGPGRETRGLAAPHHHDGQVFFPGDAVQGGVEVGQHVAREDVQRTLRHVQLEEDAAVGVLLDHHAACLEQKHGRNPSHSIAICPGGAGNSRLARLSYHFALAGHLPSPATLRIE